MMLVRCQNCGATYTVPDGHNPAGYYCSACGCQVLVPVPPPQPNPIATLGGAAGGAAIGASVGGPVGAIIGGVIGFIIVAAAAKR